MTTLHEVAEAFRATMPKEAHVSVFRIDSLDRIGIPVAQANLILPDEPATIGYGYGFRDDRGEVGALGELCEEVHVGAWVKRAPRLVASYAELLRRAGSSAAWWTR
jgi:ribosomal protein S12 methylthiotransferase accessory factor